MCRRISRGMCSRLEGLSETYQVSLSPSRLPREEVMSEEWNEIKRKKGKKTDERDLVLEDKLWAIFFWILIASGLIALDLWQKGILKF